MNSIGFLHQVISDEGFIAANTLAKVLHITQNDLAEALACLVILFLKVSEVKVALRKRGYEIR